MNASNMECTPKEIDENMRYDGNRIPSRFFPITNSKMVEEYITCIQRIQQIEDSYKHKGKNIAALSGSIKSEYLEMKNTVYVLNKCFETKVGRNDLCSCG